MKDGVHVAGRRGEHAFVGQNIDAIDSDAADGVPIPIR